MKILNWLASLLGSPCPRCTIGRIYHSHSEPHGWTTIKVYECDKCKTQFI